MTLPNKEYKNLKSWADRDAKVISFINRNPGAEISEILKEINKLTTEEIKMLDNIKVSDLVKLAKIFNTTDENKKLYTGYKIVRAYSAGVFAGYIESRNGREVVMTDARRLWAWSGAASLSQLAQEGTKNPENCKFPCAVAKVELLEVIEILDCTKEAEKSIREVPIWKI